MRPPSSAWMAATAVAIGGVGLLLPRWFPIPNAVTVILVVVALMLLLLALMYWGERGSACDAASPQLRRRYTRELMGSMSAYVLVLFASVWLLKRVDDPVLRAAVALLPVPPIAFALRAMVRYIRDTDEMQRRIELEAVSIATAFVSMLYMTGGFLQSAKVIDVPASAAMIWVFPLVCFSYGVAKALVLRRYR